MLLQRNFSFASNSTTKVKNVVINVPSVVDSSVVNSLRQRYTKGGFRELPDSSETPLTPTTQVSRATSNHHQVPIL